MALPASETIPSATSAALNETFFMFPPELCDCGRAVAQRPLRDCRCDRRAGSSESSALRCAASTARNRTGVAVQRVLVAGFAEQRDQRERAQLALERRSALSIGLDSDDVFRRNFVLHP